MNRLDIENTKYGFANQMWCFGKGVFDGRKVFNSRLLCNVKCPTRMTNEMQNPNVKKQSCDSKLHERITWLRDVSKYCAMPELQICARGGRPVHIYESGSAVAPVTIRPGTTIGLPLVQAPPSTVVAVPRHHQNASWVRPDQRDLPRWRW